MFRYLSLSLVLVAAPALASSPERFSETLKPVKEQSRLGCDFWRIDAVPLPYVAEYLKSPISIQICRDGPGLENMVRQNEIRRAEPVVWSGSITDCGIWLRQRVKDEEPVTYNALCGGGRFEGPTAGQEPAAILGEIDTCKLYAVPDKDGAMYVRWGFLTICSDGRSAAATWRGIVRKRAMKGGPIMTGPYLFTATSEPEAKGAGLSPSR